MTTRTLRARVWMALAASVLSVGVTLSIGANQLDAAFSHGPSGTDPNITHAIRVTLGTVFAMVTGTLVALVTYTLHSVARRIAPLREAVHALAHAPGVLAEPPSPHAPLHDVDGDVLHLSVHRAREQLHQLLTQVRTESERHRTIIDTVFAAVFAVDGGGRIVSVNPAAARMFGLPAATLQGAVLSDLIAPDALRMTVDEYGSVMYTGAPHEQRFTTRIRLFGHRSFPAEVSVTPMTLDGQRAWAVFIHDLTEKQRVEAALEDSRLAAETASRAKAAFLARMSHELRTPLNSMIGFTRIVRRSRSSQLSERDRHYLERVQAGSEHLLVLLSDILDLSAIESGTIEMALELVDVSPIVRDILSGVEDLVTDRPVQLESELPEVEALAMVDAARLRQVLTNLVDNAVKFTARGSVHVSVRLNPVHGRASAVIVRDTGIGIPLDRQSRIFDSFEQGGEETNHRYGGTGLGLALSRRIAEEMGCSLSVESMPGAGSTFTLAFSRIDAKPASTMRVLATDAA